METVAEGKRKNALRRADSDLLKEIFGSGKGKQKARSFYKTDSEERDREF